MNLPDLNELLVLKILINDPHLTRCAQRLNLTQSAISHTLARLRTRFADPLLVKSGKGFEATEFLLSLEPLLDEAIRSAEAVDLHRVVFDPLTSSRSFNIGMPELVSIPFIPAFLKDIRELAPGIVLNFSSITPQDAGAPLEEKKLDLYIGQIKSPAPNLKSQLLYKENFVCLARKNYKIFKNGKIGKEEYLKANHLKLSLQSSQKSYVDAALAEFGVSRPHVMTLPFYLLGFEIMRHEDVLMTAPNTMARHVLREFSMQRFYQTAPFPYSIESLPISQFWHMRSDRDAAFIWLRQMIKATGKKIAGEIHADS